MSTTSSENVWLSSNWNDLFHHVEEEGDTGIVDRDSDVLLLLPKQHRLRVSGEVLSMLSLPFKGPLFDHITEDHPFRERSPEKPLELELLDDDHMGMALLMSITHLQVAPSFTPSFEWLAALMVVAEKWWCTRAIGAQCDDWLTRFLMERLHIADMRVLAKVAYTLDNAVLFSRVTYKLIVRSNAQSLKVLEPPFLRAQVENRNTEAIHSMKNAIDMALYQLKFPDVEHEFELYLKACQNCYREILPDIPNNCPHCHQTNLKSIKCRPLRRYYEALDLLSGAYKGSRIEDLCPFDVVRNHKEYFPFSKYVGDMLEGIHTCSGGASCPIKHVLRDLKRQLENILNHVRGLSLEEFKKDVQRAAW